MKKLLSAADALRIVGILLEEFEESLSDWERQFCRDLLPRLTRRVAPSLLQSDRIRELALRHGISLTEGLTVGEAELWD